MLIGKYDLRSDTFTMPDEGMRKAIYMAEVGDDVYGEDPSVNRLEEIAADITGKERALFVSSGSMGNLIPLMIKGGLGKEVLTAREAHIVRHEVGAVVSLARTMPVYVASKWGIIDPDDLRRHLHPYAYDASEPSVVEVEDTTSGIVYPIETLERIMRFAHQNGLWVHMDGARVFNASIESRISVQEIASFSDDITFCLSKGLGAPMGSLLCGPRSFIEEARRIRKILGGGLRESGFMAAAGIYALENNITRLRDDHEHRADISSAIEKTGLFSVVISSTNMIFFKAHGNDEKAIKSFARRGILILKDGEYLRAVTSLNINDEDTKEISRLIGTIERTELE